MKVHFRRLLMSSLIALLALLLLAVAAQAQQPSPTPDIEIVTDDPIGGVDIVFLIDNSGSMFCEMDQDLKCIGPGSDPDALRFEMVEHFTRWLGVDNLRSYPSREHRLGVITFGSSDRLSADLELISLKTQSDDQLQDRQHLVEGRLSREQMGKTDFIPAYTQASRLPWAQQPSDRSRIKALILLTDGHPWVPSINGVPRLLDNGQQNPNFYGAYFQALQALLDRHFPAATTPQSPDGYHRWVIFLGSDWGAVSSQWAQIVGGNARQILTSSEIPLVVHDIMATIYPMGEFISPDFDMPPYLSGVAFTVYGLSKLTSIDDITFLGPDQAPIPPASITFGEKYGDAIIRREISAPQPGKWAYRTKAATRVKVSWDKFLPELQLVEPQGAPTQLTETRIAFRLVDQQGRAIKLLPEYPVAIDAKLTWPNGQTRALPFVQTADSAFASQELVLVDAVGDYYLDVSALTTYGDRQAWNVIRPARLRFRVGAPQGQLVWGAPGDVLAPFHYHPLTFRLVSSTGSTLVIAPEYALQVEIEAASGAPLTLGSVAPQPDGSFVTTAFVTDRNLSAGSVSATATIRNQDGQAAILCQTLLADARIGALDIANMSPLAQRDVVKQGVPTKIAFDLVWQGGLFDPSPQAPLSLDGSFVKSPTGVTRPLTGFTRAGSGRYELTTLFDAPGQWEIHINGKAQAPSGQPVEAFREVAWAAQVIETVEASLDVIAPTHGARLSYRQPETVGSVLWFSQPEPRPLEITFQTLAVRGGQGLAPTALADIAQPGVALSDLLAVNLVGPDRQDYASRLQWRADPHDGSVMRAVLTPPYPLGAYKLAADWTSRALDLMRPEYAPRSGGQQIEFQVAEGQGLLPALAQMVPYIWSMGALAALGLFFYGRAQPLGGRLIVRELSGVTRREQAYPIASRWRWRTIKPANWIASAYRVSRIRITGQGPGEIRVQVRSQGNPVDAATLSAQRPTLDARKRTIEVRYEPPPRPRVTQPRPRR